MAAKPPSSLAWARHDRRRHAYCRLYRLADGWRLSGMSVFFEQHACSLRYEVLTTSEWITRGATVEGHMAGKPISLRVQASRAGRWRVNGEAQPRIEGCVDLDLAFTPATNLIAIKRLALKVGEGADAPAAYLDFPRLRFIVLPQTYHRVSATEYDYASPTAGYAERLVVTREGWADEYPGVFKRVTGRER